MTTKANSFNEKLDKIREEFLMLLQNFKEDILERIDERNRKAISDAAEIRDKIIGRMKLKSSAKIHSTSARISSL